MTGERDALSAIVGIPRAGDEPVFREPWEAQAFALALTLHERGLFSWAEWADALAGAITRASSAGDPDTGERYYHHWLAALEALVTERGVTDPETLARHRAGWSRAAARTPHGTPIELLESDVPA